MNKRGWVGVNTFLTYKWYAEIFGASHNSLFFSVYSLFCCHCSYIFMFKIKQSINQKTMRWRSGISFGAVSKFKDLNLKMKKKKLKQFVKLTQDAFPSKLYVWKAGRFGVTAA